MVNILGLMLITNFSYVPTGSCNYKYVESTEGAGV
jgi:hypothetical protein